MTDFFNPLATGSATVFWSVAAGGRASTLLWSGGASFVFGAAGSAPLTDAVSERVGVCGGGGAPVSEDADALGAGSNETRIGGWMLSESAGRSDL